MSFAHGSVTVYGLSFYADYEQDSDAEPTNFFGAAFGAAIAASTAGDVFAGTLTVPNASTLDFYEASYGAGTYMLASSNTYSTIPALIADYPSGTYNFSVTSGTTSGQDGDLVAIPHDFSNEIPYLSGGTYSALQMWPSGVDAPIAWAPFTHGGAAPNLYSTFYLFDYTGRALPFLAQGDENKTADTIPGTAMISGHYYGYTLSYECQSEYPNAGFGTALGYTTFLRRTSGLLHCASNPGTVAGQMVLEDFYYPSGEQVEVQVLDDDGNPIEIQTITVGDYGYYAFDSSVKGVHTITFQGRHWLRKAVTGVDLSVGQDTINPSLKNGDIDHDNSITVFDYGVLSDYFDKDSSMADWLTVGQNGFAPVDADIDGDSAVTVFDYGVISNNFDLNGD